MGSSISKSQECKEVESSDGELKTDILQLNDQCKIKKIPYFFSDIIKLDSSCPVFIAYDSKYGNINDKTAPQLAVKLLPNETEYDQFRIQEELNVINRLSNNSNFIQFISHFDLKYRGENYTFFVSNYYKNSDLYEFSLKNNQLKEDDKCYITFQMLTILQTLKNKKIVHNDIKLENFLVKSTLPPTILLIDFDYAQIINKCSCSCNGTIPYMSPEVLYNEQHDYAADIWSLGISVYFLLFKSFPFNFNQYNLYNKTAILSCIENNELVRPSIPVSDDAWECVCEMLNKDQTDRITVEKALRLNWFKNMKYKINTSPTNDDMKN